MSTLWQSHSFTVVLSQPGTTDADFLTYLPDLSRVRIDVAQAATIPPTGSPLNSNPYFETDASGWELRTAPFNDGSAARSTTQAHQGTASLKLTVTAASLGASGMRTTNAASPLVTPGEEYQFTAWAYSTALGGGLVQTLISWLDAGDAFISSSLTPSGDIPLGTWTPLGVSGTAPVGAAKARCSVYLNGIDDGADADLYIDEAALYEGGGGPVPAGATMTVERSTDLINWTPVRGGKNLPVDADAVALDDFEFVGNSENHYRMQVFVEDTLYWTFRDSISVVLDAIWLKPVKRPFLARTVTVTNYDAIERTARSGVFDVVGRSLPVAVFDVHGSKRCTLELTTVGLPAAREMDLIVSSGDVFYVQGPADCPVPDGYYLVGDLSQSRKSTRGDRRYFTLPLSQVASPSAVLKGVTFTWRSLANRYATWTDVINAQASWRLVLDLIGTPEDVVVP